jgi:GT2 family glycosyltransferase
MSQNVLETNDIAAIIVTHNRRTLLATCVRALMSQTHPSDIIVVDNASNDSTEAYLLEKGFIDDDRVHYLHLNQNLGGAGGFYRGLRYAMSHGWKWFWLMDDDASPQPSALKNLVEQAKDLNTVYGSAPVGIEDDKKRLCWTMTAVSRPQKVKIEYHDALNETEEVERMPFLGLFLHRSIVRLVGLPDPNFFIYHDDNEYCERARKSGVRFVLVKNSIIMHPLQKMKSYNLLGRKIRCRSMPPWKIYYDVRNTIRIANRHYPFSLWTKTITSVLLRLACALSTQRDRLPVLHAYTMGFVHGLLNIGGRKLFPRGTKGS